MPSHAWAPAEIFVGGGGNPPKKNTTEKIKVAKKPSHGEKGPP